jgi:hypothetical protein
MVQDDTQTVAADLPGSSLDDEELSQVCSENIGMHGGVYADDIYLAGRPMFHFDGVTWQRVEKLTTWRNYTYWDVWGTSSTDVYTVNTDERFAHFDGEQWRWVPTPLDYSTSLWHLWNSAPDDLFIVGSLGAIKHYGAAPTPTPSPTPAWQKTWLPLLLKR